MTSLDDQPNNHQPAAADSTVVSAQLAATLHELPGDWWAQAACRDRLDLDWIEPTARQARQCRVVCAECPVQTICLRVALVNGEPWGIWGGLEPHERVEIAERDGYPMPASLPPHGTNPRYAKHNCRCTLCRQAHTIHERIRREQRPL